MIDEFTDEALRGCLALLDTLPDTVYRVCDLLLAVFSRNGLDFKEKVLKNLMEQVQSSVVRLLERNSSENDVATFLCSSDDATKAAAVDATKAAADATTKAADATKDAAAKAVEAAKDAAAPKK